MYTVTITISSSTTPPDGFKFVSSDVHQFEDKAGAYAFIDQFADRMRAHAKGYILGLGVVFEYVRDRTMFREHLFLRKDGVEREVKLKL